MAPNSSSLSIVAIEPNGLPQHFSQQRRPRAMNPTRPSLSFARSKSNRSKSINSSRRRRRSSSKSHHPSKFTILESETNDEEDLLLFDQVSDEREPPPAPEYRPLEEERSMATARSNMTTASSARRGFFSRQLSSASSVRFGVFKGRKWEKIVTERKTRNDADDNKARFSPSPNLASSSSHKLTGQRSVPKLPIHSPSHKSTRQRSAAMSQDPLLGEDVVCFHGELQGDYLGKRRATAPVPMTRAITNRSTANYSTANYSTANRSVSNRSFANRSLSNRSYTTSASRRSRRSSSNLIRAPYLKGISDDDDDNEEDDDDDDDTSGQGELFALPSDEDESRQDEEIRWLVDGRSDRSLISSVGGGSLSRAGVESVIGDPTEVCGLLQDVMYRDFRKFVLGCKEGTGIIGYQDIMKADWSPVLDYAHSGETSEGEFH